ncbi:MAG: hypothetical protein AB7D06_17035 [Pedobacter sp.]
MTKAYELIFKQMENLYVWLTDRLPARQDGLFRTYLWSASLALTLDLMLLQKSPVFPVMHWQAFAVVSAALALLIVGFCLDSLRGKDADNIKAPDYCAYLDGLADGTYDDETAMRFLVDQTRVVIQRQIAVQSSRAKRLRGISMYLMTSFVLLLIAGALFILS